MKKKFRLVDYNDIINDWSEYEELTAKEAIVAYCHQCCCYQSTEVKLCPAKSCPLYLFKEKWYKTPKKMSFTEEQLAKKREQMKIIGKLNKRT